MDLEKECGALGGLFQLIMNDMKASFPTWEDFITKGIKLQSQLRTTLSVTGAFLDAFQKVADMATGTRGATKDIGTALTRMCLRHRSIESKLKLFTTALSEGLIFPLEQRLDEWKRVANQLDKDHAKEYKKARAELKKKSSDTIKLQRKVKKGKGEARGQLDSALQDVNVRYVVLEETEKRAVCRALIEERSRYCSFVSMLKPVLDHEINMLGEVTHLQTIVEELTNLTAEPHKLPPASEQVLLDIKGSDFNYSYQTPPASPGSSLSRKSSISSNYQCGSVRHVPSLDSISADSLHLQQSAGLTSQQCLTDGGGAVSENGLLAPPHNTYSHPGERPRALSASGKSCTAREQLTLTLGSLQSDASRSSRDSLHCSSGYSTQTTTPSCSEDTIHSHIDYESISLHGDAYSLSLHQLHQGLSQTDFDKSSTMPHNSDLAVQFRKFAQSKRPTSTVSLLADGETLGGSHTATIRRKPSSKPAYRRGTISGGVPIPILTPQVPLKAQLSHENLPGAPPVGVLGNNKLCSSTQSLSALPHGHPSANASQYYQLIPGQMPIPVPVPTIPENPQVKQQEFVKHFQEQQSQVHARPNRPPVTQQKPTQCQVQYQQQFYGESANMYQNDIPSHPQIPAPLPPQKQLGLTQPQRQQQYQQQNHPQNQTLPSSLSQAEGPGPQNQTLPSSLSQAEGPGPQNQTLPSSLSQAEGPGPQNQTLPSSLSQAEGPGPQKQTLPQLSTQNQVLEEVSLPGSMVSMIRQVKLRRTVTNDRSAPLLPPPINHK